MAIDKKTLKEIRETKYLSVENTWRYRPIIRIFYKNYEKMKYWLYKEDIFEDLKKYEEFKDYTLDNLKYDLDTLADNKNLLTLQDTSRVKTVDEFKNKQFRYQLSPYTIEIERMVIRLENLTTENHASLEPTLIERFKEKLIKINEVKHKEVGECYEWWKGLNSDFKNLNENYQDYLRTFYSPKAEELMKTTEFLTFKERLIKYLREFIRELQINSFKIEKIFKEIGDQDIKEIIGKVLEYEKTIPRIDFVLNEDDFLENNLGRYSSMKGWFVADNFNKSDSEKLLDFTNEIILKITRYAAQISERKNSSATRKMEYRKLLSLFHNARDMEEANKLSSVTIGIFNMRHIRGNTIRETESINSSIYDEKSHEFIIKPRIKAYRERIAKSPIREKGERKRQLAEEHIARINREREIMESLINENIIDFEKLPLLLEFQRHTLLRWLSKANGNKSRVGRTEYGRDYHVEIVDSNKLISVKCEDGEFKMPECIIRFR